MPGSYGSDGGVSEASVGEGQMAFDAEDAGTAGDVDLKSSMIDTSGDNNWIDDSARHEDIDEDNGLQSVDSEPGHYSWKRADGRQRSQSLDEEDDEADNNSEISGKRDERAVRTLPTGIDDLPLFADEKNRELHAQIRVKEARYEAAKRELAETSSRVEIMTEHLKNVQQELLHTQALHGAKLKEVESEEHMRQLAQREIGRVAQEVKVLDAEAAELERKLAGLQGSLFKGNEAMDAFKLQMNWNQDEMEQWAVAARQKEEDSMALERYRRADETRIKELTLALEKLTQQLTRAKREVDDEATETQAKQIELDKTTEEFRSLHAERAKLVAQWQSTLEAMRARDEEITQASEQFALAQRGLRSKQELLGEQKRRLKQQEAANNEAQAQLAGKERAQSKAQLELQQTGARLQAFRDQVELLKNELSSAVAALNQQRSTNSNRDDRLEAMKQELEAARARFKGTRKALERCHDSTLDAEALAKQAEADLADMENEVKRLNKEIAVQKEQMFRKSQQLFALRQQEASLVAELSGAKSAAQNLRSKLRALDAQALRQQELVYNGEFQIQQMERKVARASGERSADETKALQAQIQVLQMELDRVKAEQVMLTAQCKKLEDERRAQERSRKALIAQQREVDAQIAEHELCNESCAHALKASLKNKEELLIQHDLQALEVRRLSDLLHSRADEVLSLENRDFQLKKSMEERKREIAAHQELQRAANKAIEDERHRVSVELADRESRVRKLQAKFETLCKMGAYADDGDDAGEAGKERSQAYFVIRAAQRREELQREGDELDDKIRVAEKDVRALKKTLAHLEERNSAYRKSFHRADLAGDDAERLAALEAQAKMGEDTFFKKKKELARVELDVTSETQRLREVETQRDFARANATQLEGALSQVEREVQTERAKWGKVVKKLERQMREHRQFAVSAGGFDDDGTWRTKEQVMLEALEFKEISASLLYTLGQLANEFPEIGDPLQMAVRDAGMHIPTVPPGRTAAARADGGGLPRPMSSRSDKSDRSVRSVASNGSYRSNGSNGSGVRVAAPISKVQLGF
ncbi:Coiled-coil domain-containing protein 39 [Phytophthora idaei]|nr:Coiled-coil domain-containing protein 39 [Phytophthora idaei]KAG3131072.1 Coiled-coil domain-containing protein 39 [Phytophthora idaei]KAG3234407.1 Coiled-coil domain-containing protein 39 [Phytophthora idaei]